MTELAYKQNTASSEDIKRHWLGCKFDPPLESYADADEYSAKILENAERFECWADNELAGLVAIYTNDEQNKLGFITMVSVMAKYESQGIAKHLMTQAIKFCATHDFVSVGLEVHIGNDKAVHIYEKFGFKVTGQTDTHIQMSLDLEGDA